MRLAIAALLAAVPAIAAAQSDDRDELMEQIAEAMFLASMCEGAAIDEEAAFTLIDEAGIDREEARDRMSIEFTELLSEADEDMEAASCETASALYGTNGTDWPGLMMAGD